jgi:peroxiredoxin
MLPIATAVLVLILVVAGVGKLSDPAGSRKSMADFGLPPNVAPAVALCELATAAALLMPGLARVGAFGALVLFTAFTGVITVNVARGRTPECHCFGRLSSGPVGWSTVARNLLFLVVAAYVVVGGWSLPVFGVLAVASAGAWLWLRPQTRRGQSAPRFSMVDEDGQTRTIDSLLARGGPVLLVFSHPGCAACHALLPEIGRWQAHFASRISIAVVTRGVPESYCPATDPSVYRTLGMDPFLVDTDGAVARGYGITATPSAVLIDEHGRIASRARGPGEIVNLVAETLEPDSVTRLSRRRLIARAGIGVASLGVLPLLAAACGSGKSTPNRPKTLSIDGAHLCDQRFALCTDAPCVPSKTDPGIVICSCVVEDSGYSVGFKSCDERAPSGDSLHSNFSTALVTSTTRSLTCPAQYQWANCLDVPCTVDPTDPTKVNCDCLLVKTGPSVTFGGNCDTGSCSSVIWSAATPDLPGSAQLKKGMQQLDLPLDLPKPCT